MIGQWTACLDAFVLVVCPLGWLKTVHWNPILAADYRKNSAHAVLFSQVYLAAPWTCGIDGWAQDKLFTECPAGMVSALTTVSRWSPCVTACTTGEHCSLWPENTITFVPYNNKWYLFAERKSSALLEYICCEMYICVFMHVCMYTDTHTPYLKFRIGHHQSKCPLQMRTGKSAAPWKGLWGCRRRYTVSWHHLLNPVLPLCWHLRLPWHHTQIPLLFFLSTSVSKYIHVWLYIFIFLQPVIYNSWYRVIRITKHMHDA